MAGGSDITPPGPGEPLPDAFRPGPGVSSPDQALAPLQGFSLLLLTIVLPLAAFIQVLDNTIAVVAIPTIVGSLGASSSQGTWLVTAYSVANAIALPLSGWLGRRMGEVRLFLWSIAAFTFISFLCGLASSLEVLVLLRLLQGFTGAPLMTLSQSLIINNYPRDKRAMAIALWSMTASIAPIFGPLVGGYISDNYYWGWIFFFKIPIGVLVLGFSWWLLRGRESFRLSLPVDVGGLVLLTLGIGAFQFMLDSGKDLDWFNSPLIVSLAIIAAVGLILLVIWELTSEHPVVNLFLLSNRNFCIGIIITTVVGFVYIGTVALLPLLIQTQLRYTPTMAGLLLAPSGICAVLLTPVMGKYADRVDLRLLIIMGSLAFVAAMWMRTFFSPAADMLFIIIPQMVQGVGMALFFTPATIVAFSTIKAEDMASASSLFNFVRILAGALGTSVCITMWHRREALHHTVLSSRIDPYNPAASDTFAALEGLGLNAQEGAAWVAHEITRQGFILGAAEIYWLCAVLLALSAIPVFFMKTDAGK